MFDDTTRASMTLSAGGFGRDVVLPAGCEVGCFGLLLLLTAAAGTTAAGAPDPAGGRTGVERVAGGGTVERGGRELGVAVPGGVDVGGGAGVLRAPSRAPRFNVKGRSSLTFSPRRLMLIGNPGAGGGAEVVITARGAVANAVPAGISTLSRAMRAISAGRPREDDRALCCMSPPLTASDRLRGHAPPRRRMPFATTPSKVSSL